MGVCFCEQVSYKKDNKKIITNNSSISINSTKQKKEKSTKQKNDHRLKSNNTNITPIKQEEKISHNNSLNNSQTNENKSNSQIKENKNNSQINENKNNSQINENKNNPQISENKNKKDLNAFPNPKSFYQSKDEFQQKDEIQNNISMITGQENKNNENSNKIEEKITIEKNDILPDLNTIIKNEDGFNNDYLNPETIKQDKEKFTNNKIEKSYPNLEEIEKKPENNKIITKETKQIKNYTLSDLESFRDKMIIQTKFFELDEIEEDEIYKLLNEYEIKILSELFIMKNSTFSLNILKKNKINLKLDKKLISNIIKNENAEII